MPTPRDILAVLDRAGRDPVGVTSTDDLARIAGWSPSHLHRAFRQVTGETPKAWTTRVRLATAIGLLRKTDLRIAEVAARSGFASHEVLARTVRRVLGTTPTALREADGADHLEHAACLALYHLSLAPRRPPMPVDITVQTREPQPILYLRRRVRPQDLQRALAECLPAVFAHCQQHGVAFAGAPFTRYVEMSRGHFTIEAGMPVAAATADGDIQAGALPGGEIAVAIHAGPYDTLGDTHGALEAWASANGREPAGGAWESYITDPGQTPDPADWRTEVCLPLR